MLQLLKKKNLKQLQNSIFRLNGLDKMEQTKTTAFKYALKWGAILGLVRITINIGMYLTNENMNWAFVLLPAMFIIPFFLVRYFRDKQREGYLAFNKAFILCLQIIIYSGVLLLAFELIFSHYFITGFNSQILKHTEQSLAGSGVTDEELKNKMLINKILLKNQSRAIISTIIMGFAFSLIIAAICKKERDTIPVE